MARSLEVARRLGEVGAIEESLLSDPANPIVLLERHVAKDTAEGTRVAPQVAPGMNTIGLFLPTTPLHQLLLNDLDFPIVATSGNRGDEPLALDRSEALANLSDIADVFLDHDRPVERRIDDSVVRVIDDRPVSFRLARGYAPLALPALESFANKAALAPVVAVGGHQKVALALWSGSQAILGPHVGDMDTLATRAAFSAQYDQLCALYGFEPVAIACDLHPDYFTTQWAGVQGKSLIPVQHHHAHAVSAMVEHDLLDREVFALVWDGTGYGPDGTIWGGEVLVARVASYQRVASLRPFALAGNEAAIREPWRIALVMLAEAPGNEPALSSSWLLDRFRVSRREAETVLQMARKGINTSWTSSVGRLFDAVASIVLGIREVSYEGEAAILLESVAESHESSAYKPPIHLEREVEAYRGDSFVIRGDWRPMLRAIVRDVAGGVATGVVAARFHNTLARWASALVARQPPRDVVLGGGCFQNRLLAERCRAAIEDVSSARVYGPGVIPPGDGGLAVGQLGVALAQLKQNKTYRTNTTNKGGANVSRNSWAGD
jgi:hydrogenase maturation protein HypF